MRKPRLHIPLTLATAALVLLIAALTGGTLAIARRLQRRAAARTAAYRVLDAGRRITAHLSHHADLPAPEAAEPDWQAFRRLIESIHAIEDALQYVSISRDDVVLFHQQTQALDPGAEDGLPPPPLHADDIRLYPQVVQAGDDRIPVVVFSRTLPTDDGPPAQLEVALRQAAVWREELAAAEALAAMFRLAMLTLTVSFGCCALLIVWMMRRETHREARRRTAEHLAFSGVLANGIVHDFRNPMSAMRLDVQMLNREIARGGDSRPERIATLAERVRATLDRMDSVFEEFLSLSRSPGDHHVPIPLPECLKACIQILQPRMERAGVTMRLTGGADGLTVMAHPGALRRALLNVLTNAEQWSSRDSEVQVRIDRERDAACITIDDTGPGIPPRLRTRVFERFYTTRPEGTGLGLFLAAETIRRAGGSIRVADKPGPGTRIEIRLPLAATPAANTKDAA